THVAARMEQLATPGSILLAPETLRLVEGSVQVRALGPATIKGLSAPVEIHELVGVRTAQRRLHVATAQRLTRFVGRDTELATLRRRLERAGSGRGQVVALVGEPGIGKSRLVWEAIHPQRDQGWLVLQGRSVSHGKASAYAPVVDLLRAYWQLEGSS